jgi:hypothetical protein
MLTNEEEEPEEAVGDTQESVELDRSPLLLVLGDMQDSVEEDLSPRRLVPGRSLAAEKQTFSSRPLFTVKWRSRNGHFKIPSFLHIPENCYRPLSN